MLDSQSPGEYGGGPAGSGRGRSWLVPGSPSARGWRGARPVFGYVPKGKAKARVVCEAFVRGAGGGHVYQPPPRHAGGGAACFFGVTEATREVWLQVRRGAHDWYYLDNAYFDVARGRLFRAARNAVQASGQEPPDWPRLAALGVRMSPWRKDGRHVLVVPQSSTYMKVVASYIGCWWRDAVAVLRRHTDREIRVRGWRSDKRALAVTLAQDLRDCWALVTWSSAAANEALLAGVPVFTAGACAAARLGLDDLSLIEKPLYPSGRAFWAATLAGRQWSLDELRDGVAWRALHA